MRALGLLLLLFASIGAAGPGSVPAVPRLRLWQSQDGIFEPGPQATDAPLSVGSLQKPFIAKAWSLSHPGASPPRYTCGARDTCWLRSGHGELGLSEALAQSCNTYFRHLAEATPASALRSAFLDAGFTGGPTDAAQAVGLAEGGPMLRIRPSDLLRAYGRLLSEPWPSGEPVRHQILAGLREAALSGTASGLGLRGFWAKTGTVPEADSLHTTGLALVLDDAGWAMLAELRPGTGSEAAMALTGPVSHLRSGHARRIRTRSTALRRHRIVQTSPSGLDPAERPVTVRLFDLMRLRRPQVRNLGAAPIPMERGFLGPAATAVLHPGDRVGPGLVELRDPGSGLRRRLFGLVRCEAGPGGSLRLHAALSAHDYVDGVVAAELPSGDPARRLALAAAVLRFLAHGPRHSDADVCDSTHCAWFVGRGPLTRWTSPTRAESGPEAPPGLDDGTWARAVAASREPGPDQWTSHCGGRRLSGQELWGNGDTRVEPCPRHASESRPWTRDWKAADLKKAFGEPVQSIEAAHEDGVWVLRITGPSGPRSFRYDDAHRCLASVLGWGALPSPADRVDAIPGGFRAGGVGLGHRVGLCLAD